MFIFASESSVHGFTFIFGNNRRSFVRIMWSFLLIISTCALSFYIYEAYQKWNNFPDISIKSREHLANNIPMPAVTICPRTFTKEAQVTFDQAMDIYYQRAPFNGSKEKCEVLVANSEWCNDRLINSSISLGCQHFKDDLLKMDIVDVLNRSAYHKEEVFSEGFQLLSRVLTLHGFCYTYNMQDFSAIFNENIHDDFKCYKNQQKVEWSVERGYFNENSTYPYKATLVYPKFILQMTPQDIKNACNVKIMGIFVHLPHEVLTNHHQAFFMDYGTQKTFKLQAKSHRSDESLRSYSPSIRKCYFDGERKLKFFKAYSKAHCNVECFANVLLKTCGCVKYWMPRDNQTRVCKFTDLPCIHRYNEFYTDTERVLCVCHPSCNDIKYSIETELINIDKQHVHTNRPNATGSMIILFFISETYEEFENFIAYKLHNFISDVGGLLGLFLGCSLLSLVEILYLIVNGIAMMFTKKKVEMVLEPTLDTENTKVMEKLRNIENELQSFKIDVEERFENINQKILRLLEVNSIVVENLEY